MAGQWKLMAKTIFPKVLSAVVLVTRVICQAQIGGFASKRSLFQPEPELFFGSNFWTAEKFKLRLPGFGA